MNKTFAVLAVSAFALMGCDSGTANAQNPSAMPAMSAEMQQQHDNMQKEIKQIRDQHAQIMDEHKTMKSDIRNLQDNQKKIMDEHRRIMDDHQKMMNNWKTFSFSGQDRISCLFLFSAAASLLSKS